MALTANVTVHVLDLAAKRARITGTVADDVAGTEIAVEILDTVIDTDDLAGERLRITNALFAAYETAKVKADAIAALLTTWGAALTSDLQAKVDE